MTTEQPRIITGDHHPFPRTGLSINADGIARYDDLPPFAADLPRTLGLRDSGGGGRDGTRR